MTYVLFVAILNLSLGVVAAVVLKHRMHASPARAVKKRKRKPAKLKGDGATRAPSRAVDGGGGKDAVPAEPPREFIALPHDWAELLKGQKFSDLIEPSGWMLRHVAIQTVGKLIEGSRVVELLPEAREEGPFAKTNGLMKDCHKSLLERLQQVESNLQSAGFQFGPLTSIAVRLETLCQNMRDDLTEVESLVASAQADQTRRGELLKSAYHSLVRKIHDLRDQATEIAVAVIVTTKRVADHANESLKDAEWQLPSRLDMEATLAEWFKQDPTNERLASVVLFDIDGLGRINEDFGLERAERILTEVSKVYFDGIRHNRGFDRIFRVTGQRYALFLGDTSAKNSSFAAERIRQALLQMTFRCRNRAFQVASTSVVTAVQKTDSVDSILERMHLAVRKVKRTDSRATVIIHEGKILPTEPKVYQLPGKAVDI